MVIKRKSNIAEICILGSPCSARKHDRIIRIIEWSIENHSLQKLDLYIEIELTSGLLKNKGAYGFTIWEDNNIRPREFSIELDAGIRGDELVSTIIHEMVHVWQYARGRLVDTKVNNKKKWLGQKITVEESDYENLSWEIEASKLELELLKEYKNGR